MVVRQWNGKEGSKRGNVDKLESIAEFLISKNLPFSFLLPLVLSLPFLTLAFSSIFIPDVRTQDHIWPSHKLIRTNHLWANSWWLRGNGEQSKKCCCCAAALVRCLLFLEKNSRKRELLCSCDAFWLTNLVSNRANGRTYERDTLTQEIFCHRQNDACEIKDVGAHSIGFQY